MPQSRVRNVNDWQSEHRPIVSIKVTFGLSNIDFTVLNSLVIIGDHDNIYIYMPSRLMLGRLGFTKSA